MGVQKPDRAFFDMVLKETGIDKRRTLVIGDSEKSDILGATNSGMRSIFISLVRAEG